MTFWPRFHDMSGFRGGLALQSFAALHSFSSRRMSTFIWRMCVVHFLVRNFLPLLAQLAGKFKRCGKARGAVVKREPFLHRGHFVKLDVYQNTSCVISNNLGVYLCKKSQFKSVKCNFLMIITKGYTKDP